MLQQCCSDNKTPELQLPGEKESYILLTFQQDADHLNDLSLVCESRIQECLCNKPEGLERKAPYAEIHSHFWKHCITSIPLF